MENPILINIESSDEDSNEENSKTEPLTHTPSGDSEKTAPIKDLFGVQPEPYIITAQHSDCLLYTSPSPRDGLLSRMPSSA